MKLTMKRISQGEDEVIIRYREMTEEIEMLAGLIREGSGKISAFWEGNTVLLRPEEILYLESVDAVTWAYLSDKVCRVSESLSVLTACYEKRGFFRCSKSMILNIYKISYLKSEAGARIRATMENGEQVVISRKYAKWLRQILRGGNADEEV